MTATHEIIPFESVDGYAFGADRANIGEWGEPDSTEDDDIMGEFQARYGEVTLVYTRPDSAEVGDPGVTEGQELAEIWIEGDTPVRVAGHDLSDDDGLAALLSAYPHREEKRYILIPDVGVVLRSFRVKDRKKRVVSVFARSRMEFAADMLDVQ